MNHPYQITNQIQQAVFDFFNDSEYRMLAQDFLTQKEISWECIYWYSVADENSNKALAHVFFAWEVGNQTAYFIKVNRTANAVTEWYRTDNLHEDNTPASWVALDIVTNAVKEYYVNEMVDGVFVEHKHDAVTNERIATNVFQGFVLFTQEQQDKIKNLPLKQTCFMWKNKPAGLTVEFLPSFSNTYSSVEIDELNLLASI